ncbi:MAG TPA: uracil-DNA glycosylase [Edaphocola sp.]|nr:uracil-DNA glycosylase [Edaphocola sp.]
MFAPIENSWQNILASEFEQDYFKKLNEIIKSDIASGITVYPKNSDIFKAFELCPFEKTKVVLLGQDPYHGLGQANGLCFSVEKGIKLPPSLKNIYKAIQQEFAFPIPTHGDLTAWAQQGVLMLNTSLTVRAHQANSHSKIGWVSFTDAVLKTISERKENIVFILWGNNARSKKDLIDSAKHLILQSAHPSPLSAYHGFFGNKHFIQTNEYLKQHHKKEIDWKIE